MDNIPTISHHGLIPIILVVPRLGEDKGAVALVLVSRSVPHRPWAKTPSPFKRLKGVPLNQRKIHRKTIGKPQKWILWRVSYTNKWDKPWKYRDSTGILLGSMGMNYELYMGVPQMDGL